MKCPDFETLMMFLDGELRDDTLRQVSEHVRTCDRCRKVLESQRKLESSWRDGFVYPAGDEFRRVEDELYRRMNRRGVWKVLLPAAAGIIAAVLGVKLILHSGPALDRVSAVARSRMEESVLPVSEVREAEEEPVLLTDSTFVVRSDDLEAPEAAGEAVNRDIPDDSFLSYGLTGYTAADETLEETEEMLQYTSEGTVAVPEEDIRGSDPGEPAAEQVQVDRMAGGAAGMESREPDIALSLDSDTAGLQSVVTVTTRQCSESDSVPESPYWMEAESCIRLVFDARGSPDSVTALLLDSLLPDWRDYIHYEFRDTVLVVPPDGLHDLLNHDGVLPEQATE